MKNEKENTGRTIALAFAFFGALALLGAAAGVYQRLSGATLAALAIFAAGFAAATYALDPAVRAWVDERARGALGRFRRSPAKSRGAKRAAT